MFKVKIAALAMSAVCAFSAMAFASCSDSAEVSVLPTESEQNISSEADTKEGGNSNASYTVNNSKIETADGNVKLGDIFGEKIDCIMVSLSVASSDLFGKIITEEESINVVVNQLKDIELTVGESNIWGRIVYIGVYSNGSYWYDWLYSFCIKEDGAVGIYDDDGLKYFSSVGAADYNALNDYFRSKGA